MNYLLTILTNGRRTCLERTARSLAEHLDPQPARIYVFDDGAATGGAFVQSICTELEWEGIYDSSARPLGQCAAMRNCMDAAAGSEHEWVLAWEDDVVLLRPLPLADLAAVMEAEQNVAQIGLVRTPVGGEVEHGGFIPKDSGWYERRTTKIGGPTRAERERADNLGAMWECQRCGTKMMYPGGHECPAIREMEWIATTRNWQCAQALFPTACPAEFPYPREPGCETAYGPAIRGRYPDTVFGLWWAGEVWTAHVGVERAPGSHGY